MWSDVESGLPPSMMRANDSQTQLSLDYPMIENYGMILSEPAGGAAHGDAIPGWVNPLLAQVSECMHGRRPPLLIKVNVLSHSCTSPASILALT
jgi:hypothetical protein